MTYLNSLIRIGETEFDLLCWIKSYSVNQIFEQVGLLLRSQLEESFFLFVFWRHSISSTYTDTGFRGYRF